MVKLFFASIEILKKYCLHWEKIIIDCAGGQIIKHNNNLFYDILQSRWPSLRKAETTF